MCTRAQVLRDADTAGHAALKLRMDDGRWTRTSITTIQGQMGPLFEKKKNLNQVFWEERKRSDDAS